MEKYLIVTDTTSAMNKEIAAAHGIELIKRYRRWSRIQRSS